MRVISQLSKNEYLREMKEQMGRFTSFGTERFTGTIIGPFFSVTHHAGHEFNRRITNEKHRAIGFVRAQQDHTEVCCIRLAGLTNPVSLALIYIFCLLFGLFVEPEVLQNKVYYFACVFVTIIAGLATAFTDSITERGQEGSKILTAFLIDPVNYNSLMGKF